MKGKSRLIVLTVLWGLLLLMVLAFQVHLIFIKEYKKTEAAFKKGEKLPDFTLAGLDGKSYHLEELARSKEVLLVFFSATSSPCRIQVGEIADYLNKQKQPLFQVLLISDDSRNELISMRKDMQLNLPILPDSEGKVMAQYKISTVPTSYLVDRDMNLLYSQVGSEGFSVYKIQALLAYGGGKLEIQERPQGAREEAR